MKKVVILLILLFVVSGCAKEEVVQEEIIEKEVDNMKIESPNFNEGESIPEDFTCDSEDVSPELVFKDVPEGTKSLALIMDDPDAPGGTFVHWAVWNIPPDTKGISKGEKVSYPQGKNDFGKTEYGGPCPPSGVHRYFFKLYALDTMLNLKKEATKADLEKAMEGHIVAEARLMGTYQR